MASLTFIDCNGLWVFIASYGSSPTEVTKVNIQEKEEGRKDTT